MATSHAQAAEGTTEEAEDISMATAEVTAEVIADLCEVWCTAVSVPSEVTSELKSEVSMMHSVSSEEAWEVTGEARIQGEATPVADESPMSSEEVDSQGDVTDDEAREEGVEMEVRDEVCWVSEESVCSCCPCLVFWLPASFSDLGFAGRGGLGLEVAVTFNFGLVLFGGGIGLLVLSSRVLLWFSFVLVEGTAVTV